MRKVAAAFCSVKLQRTKNLLDDFFRDLPREDYDVHAPEHAKRALYTGVSNLYVAYHREKISFQEIFARGDVYGFKTESEFACFAYNLGLGSVPLCCNSGDKTSKYHRQSLLEHAMTEAIKFVCKE
jgi:hypothetical protein